MKTLVLFGSPRRAGDTAYLLKMLLEKIDGEHMIVDCYHENISPCVDCRACRKSDNCAINDSMQKVYQYAEKCDDLVIATPLYFSQPTGRLLDVCSRAQVYFSQRRFRGIIPNLSIRKGGVILTCGSSDTTGAQKAFETLKDVFLMFGIKDIAPPVCCLGTDKTPATENIQIKSEIERLANFLNVSA